MSGTEIVYDATCLRAVHALSGTKIAGGLICLGALCDARTVLVCVNTRCYALAMRCPVPSYCCAVLRERMYGGRTSIVA
eukprot:3361010-Rhodomonas_salina.4